MNQTFLGLDDCHDDIVGRRGYAQFGAQTTERAIDGVDFATPPGQGIEQHAWTGIGTLAPTALHMGNGTGNTQIYYLRPQPQERRSGTKCVRTVKTRSY